MLPVYFPFTSMSRPLMDAASKFFNSVTVYQVSASSIPERMKAWQDDSRLAIRLPLQRHEKEIDAILKDFSAWAAQHQGGDFSIFKTRVGTIPFFDASSVAQIRRDIKAGGGAATTAAEADRPDLYPGVFLRMAQDLDERDREVAQELRSQAMQENELIKALKGDEMIEVPEGLETGAVAGDRDAYMIPERMAAWARIMLVDDLASPMLLTSHRIALDDLVERTTRGTRELQYIQTIEAPAGDAGRRGRCREALAAFIEEIGVRAWDGEKKRPHLAWDCDSAVSPARLSLYVIPGVKPRRLVARYLTADASDAPGDKADGDTIGNTVVGVVESQKRT